MRYRKARGMLLAMKRTEYKVNEIFYSVQAEGRNAGRAAVFVRFAGCNLRCPFCDTNHSAYSLMTKEQIEKEAIRLDPTGEAMVVFTGGEPTMQLKDDEPILVNRFTAIETNGTMKPPSWIDWVTISPKGEIDMQLMIDAADEVKVLCGMFDDRWLEDIESATASSDTMLFIQPMADMKGRFDISPSLGFIAKHPRWRLSLQWHKIFGIR